MRKSKTSFMLIGFILVIVIGSVIIVGSVELDGISGNRLHQLAYGQPTIVTMAWNNRIYEVTNTTMLSSEIGSQIGSVTRQVSPKPEINGDIARNTSEGPSILYSGYGNLYQISGCDQKDKIAVELSEGQYFICEYFCKLDEVALFEATNQQQ